jgi:hypothetical protein
VTTCDAFHRSVFGVPAIGFRKVNMQACAKKLNVLVSKTAAAMLIAGAMSLVISQPAAATAEFAKQTGKSCGQCHESPAGGKLKPYGEQFKANGNKPPNK